MQQRHNVRGGQCFPSGTTYSAEAIPVLLDVDNGFGLPGCDPDDGVALALALCSPEVRLLGVTTSAGNCHTAEATLTTLRMLEMAQRLDVPVAYGADTPLIVDRSAHHAYLEKKRAKGTADYWQRDIPLNSALQPTPLLASQFLVEQIRASNTPVTLVMEAGFTNLALALQSAPEIVQNIREVVHMGGVFSPTEKEDRALDWETPDIPKEAWENTLRFNTWYDPEATAAVICSGVPLRFITANVTVHVYLFMESIHRLRAAHTEWHTFLADGLEPWLQWSMLERKLPGAHMHDPLALACVFSPTLCRYRTMQADPEAFLAGKEWLLPFSETVSSAAGTAIVAVDVDTVRFEKMLAERLLWLP